MTHPQDKTDSDADLGQIVIGLGPCTYLLLLLVGLILLFPFLEEGIFDRILLAILFSTVLLVGAFATRQTRQGVILKLCLALLGVGLLWGALCRDGLYSVSCHLVQRSASLCSQARAHYGGQTAWRACRLHPAGVRLVIRICLGRDVQRRFIRPWPP